jgi:hypothetical protein
MNERLTGKGVLSSGDKQWNVEYVFVITTSVVHKPGFPALQGRSSSIGSVSATNGASLPEGYYQLRTDDEYIRVRNNGLGQWTILAPL